VGLRYVRVEPLEPAREFLDLRLTEQHRPPVYLATVRLHRDREPAPDTAHVLEVAAPVLARLGCATVADYLERGAILTQARALVLERTRDGSRPGEFSRESLAFALAREVVTTTLDPREREVYRVTWRGEHALTFWVAERPGAELSWASARFRADPRLRPRALEHGFSYVPWALAELATVRKDLLAQPRALDLGLPLEVTDRGLLG
jgi:hypothetical protein